jgi:UDP-glucose:(heptosyl)LPS alpha-1,3-glucosyltransferase
VRLALVRREFNSSGGAELYAQRLLTALARAGHVPHLFAERWESVPVGVELRLVSVGGTRAQGPRRFAEAVERVLALEPFDCVFSLERGVAADVYRAGDGVHAGWLENWRRWGRWWKRPLAGRGAFHAGLRAADARSFDPFCTGRVIVNSGMVRGELCRHFPGFPDDRIHLVRNGVDVAGLRGGERAAWRRRLGLPDPVSLVLFAGSGWERKGLPWLLRAWRHLDTRHFALLVVGKGHRPVRPPPGVFFAGRVPPADLRDVYAAADLFVLPTLYDPCANVCLEALAAGLPVVTTRQNGAAEFVREGANGTVLESPADRTGLVSAIRHWATRRPESPVPLIDKVCMERNLGETLAVLQLAAATKLTRTRWPGGEAP